MALCTPADAKPPKRTAPSSLRHGSYSPFAVVWFSTEKDGRQTVELVVADAVGLRGPDGLPDRIERPLLVLNDEPDWLRDDLRPPAAGPWERETAPG